MRLYFRWAMSIGVVVSLFQYIFSSLSTWITIFSGFVTVAILRYGGRVSGTSFAATGMVTRKMISMTSITSTNGVVLMVVFRASSSPWATLLRLTAIPLYSA